VQLVCHTQILSLLSPSSFCCPFSTETGSIAQVELLNKTHKCLKFPMMKYKNSYYGAVTKHTLHALPAV